MTSVTEINSITLRNTTYQEKSILNSVDLNYVPWENNDMSNAFRYCQNLKKVTNINENVINMSWSFRDCTNLVDAPVIPNSVTDITNTFDNCTSLVNAPLIPDSVISMSSTFNGCTNLVNTPEIPNTVTIMYQTFRYCENLTGNIYIYSENITNTMNCFYGTSLSKNVYIPVTYENNANTLTYNSFINAGYTIDPSNRVNGVLLMDIKDYLELKEWRYNTLDNGSKLLYEYLNKTNPDVIVPNNSVIANSYNMAIVFNDVPFANKPQFNSVDLNNATFKSNSMVKAFYNCQNLTSVSNIGEDVTDMYEAFSGCINLVNVSEIPNSVTNMRSTFGNCRSLVNAPVIPDSVTDMSATFGSCSNLVNVLTISNNVMILNNCFSNCYNLVDVTNIPDSVINMYITFKNCNSLTNDITILSSQILNVDNCFDGTTLNKNVYIPFTYNVVDTMYAWTSSWALHFLNAPYIIYTLSDNPNTISTGETYKVYYENGIEHNGNVSIGSTSVISVQNLSFQYSRNSSLDIFNGENTKTYNSFINAGYTTDPSNRVNGVLLKDIATR